MQGGVWAIVASVGCSAPDLSGTLVYSEAVTAHVRILDLGTGDDELIDSGQFGSVSIAPDATHVAYAGIDMIVKLADRTGTITPLASGGCSGPGTWATNSVLTYCVSGGTMLLPSLGGTPRLLDSFGLAVSADGSTVVYVNARGDLVVENTDGSNQRVLVLSTDPTAMYPSIYVAGLTKDQDAALVVDTKTFPTRLHVVALADGTSVDVDDAAFMGTPFGSPTFLGASAFSADHSELLLQSTSGLVAVKLATGAKRPIATFAPRVSAGGAVFLDDGHVLWVRSDDHSMGDLGMFTLSLHVAGPTVTDDLVLDGPDQTNPFWKTIAVSPAGFIALPSDILLVKSDGTVLLRNESAPGTILADDILALSPDGNGVITTAGQKEVRYIGADGTNRLLATTGVGAQLTGPAAAYTPAHAP